LIVSCGLLVVAAAGLYLLQHNETLSGGAIAPSKLCWLLIVVIFWYVLPVFWLLNPGYSKTEKLLVGLFLSSMLARAIVELTMMYLSNNWLHAYGIAHDLFSVCLCLAFTLKLRYSNSELVPYFFYCALLFMAETYFAFYLQTVSHGDGTIFFLESNQQHNQVLWLTRIAVLLSLLVFFILIKRASSGSPARPSTNSQ